MLNTFAILLTDSYQNCAGVIGSSPLHLLHDNIRMHLILRIYDCIQFCYFKFTFSGATNNDPKTKYGGDGINFKARVCG